MSESLPDIPRVAIPPAPPPLPAVNRASRRSGGYLPASIVRAVTFYIIALCIVSSVVVCILAIWDFAEKDALWRLITSFLVVAAGTALFAKVNGIFSDEKNG